MTAVSPVTRQESDMEARYQSRLNRYVTAMRNGKPDMIPIRPFVAEFTGVYAGYTCQELAHDYNLAFDAARKCAADFDWDAVVPNMVYVWTGLAQALGLKYYGIPGIHIPAGTGFQYREPPAGAEFMRADEYDQLIEDPTGFLLNVWLPRVSTCICGSRRTGQRREQRRPGQGRHGDAAILHGVRSADRPPAGRIGDRRRRLRESSRPRWTSSPTNFADTLGWSRTCSNGATRSWRPAKP